MPNGRLFSLADVRRMVRDGATRCGSLRAYGVATGCSVAYLSDVLHDRREPGPKILRPLGLEKVPPDAPVRYRRVRP